MSLGRTALSGGGLIIEFERKQIGARVIMLSLAMSSMGRRQSNTRPLFTGKCASSAFTKGLV